MKKLISVVLLTAIILTCASALVSVGADSSVTLKTDKAVYKEGEPILVTASSTNSSGKDWVGIIPKGDSEGVSIYWDYLKDITANFNISTASHKGKDRGDLYSLPAGEYTILIIPDDLTVKKGYDKALAMVDIKIERSADSADTTAPKPSGDTYLVTDKTQYIVGEPIYVTASSENASGKDWVGIWPKGYVGQSIHWEYLSTIGKGKPYDIRSAPNRGGGQMTAYHGIPEGEYTLYLIPNDMNGGVGIPQALAMASIKVVSDPNKIAKAPLSATYKLDKEGSGLADGTLTIKLPEDHDADDIYMWWGDDNGKLAGYTRLARFKVTGTTVTHRMTENTLIPNRATKLLIYTYNDSNGISKDCLEVKLPAGAASGDLGKVLSEFQIVSDIHIKGGADHEYSKHFVAMLNDVKKNSPTSVGIFAAGDIVDRGDSPEYWTYFHSLYKSVNGAPPMYLGIGNHEYIGTSYEAGLKQFLQNVKLPDGSTPDKVYYDCYVNGYHYVFIGTGATGTSAPIPKEELLWLEETLKKDDGEKPVFLFLHQPMLNTVSGSSSEEGWSGISNHKELKAVLDRFPHVLMFNGHTHWILDSDNCMYDGEGKTATIFNTSSVAYLWHSYDLPTGERMTGSEGYYIRVYEDKVAVLGRNFVTGEWVSSAQFIVSLSENDGSEETTSAADETSYTPTPDETSASTPETPPSAAEPSTKGCGAFVSGGVCFTGCILLALATFKKRKER